MTVSVTVWVSACSVLLAGDGIWRGIQSHDQACRRVT
jgi:hypothetical protein